MANEVEDTAQAVAHVPARVGGGFKGIFERLRRMPKLQLAAIAIAAATLIIGYLAYRSRTAGAMPTAADPNISGIPQPDSGGGGSAPGAIITIRPKPPGISPYTAPPNLDPGGAAPGAVFSTIVHHIAPVIIKPGPTPSPLGGHGTGGHAAQPSTGMLGIMQSAINALRNTGTVVKTKEHPAATKTTPATHINPASKTTPANKGTNTTQHTSSSGTVSS